MEQWYTTKYPVQDLMFSPTSAETTKKWRPILKTSRANWVPDSCTISVRKWRMAGCTCNETSLCYVCVCFVLYVPNYRCWKAETWTEHLLLHIAVDSLLLEQNLLVVDISQFRMSRSMAQMSDRVVPTLIALLHPGTKS
jgi:hypothetical protein